MKPMKMLGLGLLLAMIALTSSGCTLQRLGYYKNQGEPNQESQAEIIVEGDGKTHISGETGAADSLQPALGQALMDETVAIDHPYDLMIQLGWEANSQVDLDLYADLGGTHQYVYFEKKKISLDKDNTLWLDYDFRQQGSKPVNEVVTVLGLSGRQLTISVINYNQPKRLMQDPVIRLTGKDGSQQLIQIAKEPLNEGKELIVGVLDVSSGQFTQMMQARKTGKADPK